jgi:hypothetical protein
MSDELIRDQAKAIREQHDQRPAPRNETAREARWRVEREKAERDAKQNPHRSY